MQPLRQQVRLVVLALFALATQFIVSFGHNHDHGGLSAVNAGRTINSQVALSVSANDAVPAKDSDDEGNCPVCASVALLAASSLPMPPLLPQPNYVCARTLVVSEHSLTVMAVATAFQARGPPSFV